MNPPDLAEVSTGITPTPRTKMPAARTRKLITLLHAYTTGRIEIRLAHS